MKALSLLCGFLAVVATSVGTAVEKPVMKPDYAKLQLKGNGHRQDSFALAIQAAARLLGKETDYDTLTCLAGNAFAPLRNLSEDCTPHCQLEAVHSDRAMATVAGYVGLRARKLELPAFEGFDVKDAERPAYLKQVATAARQALDAGEVVIALQGWKVKGPHGFTHWGYAGIDTQADPVTGRIIGAHLNGRTDNSIYHGAILWAVAPAEATLKSPAAEQVMLRQSVDYIRSQGLFAPKQPVVYGLAAMDAWIKHMQEVKGYCAPCFGRGQQSWQDAMENGERLLRAARVAAKKLRSLGPQYEVTAKHYDRIVELLKPVKYQEFIGDLVKQKAHAENVLVPVKTELAAIAEELEKAFVTPNK
jgi:hypothetical protein